MKDGLQLNPQQISVVCLEHHYVLSTTTTSSSDCCCWTSMSISKMTLSMVDSWKLVMPTSEGVWKWSDDIVLPLPPSLGRVCPAAARPIRSVGATPYIRCLVTLINDKGVWDHEHTFATALMKLRSSSPTLLRILRAKYTTKDIE